MSVRERKRKKKKTGTGIKILTPNKILNRPPVMPAQLKAGNNSYKVKNEIRQRLCLLHQHNQITKKLFNNSL